MYAFYLIVDKENPPKTLHQTSEASLCSDKSFLLLIVKAGQSPAESCWVAD